VGQCIRFTRNGRRREPGDNQVGLTARVSAAKVVLQAEFRREGATVEQASAKAEESLDKMATQLVFGSVPPARARQSRGKPQVKVLYFRSLFEAEGEDVKAALPPADEPVQLAVFAW
jgi:hypothetical protein